MDDSLHTDCRPKPWHKGRLIGRKLPLKQREFGGFEPTSSTSTTYENWPCSIWLSTANCAHVTSRRCAYAMSCEAIRSPSASRCKKAAHLSTRQYARIVARWVTSIQLDRSAYGTHTMRRTKPTLIYRRTGNLRAVQLLLGHAKIESTVRYLGVEVDDALALAEQTEA